MTVTRQGQINRAIEPTTFFNSITVGVVVDTNDPQQMGRLRVCCTALKDRFESLVGDIPWAQYGSPFGGFVNGGTRGPDDTPADGPTSYGMWAIPKVGAQVLVMCINGNSQDRVWIGCLYTPFLPHTLPHGRYFYKDDGKLPSGSKPVGPLSSTEKPIEPLYTNFRTTFGTNPVNYEWQSRGADYQASALDATAIIALPNGQPQTISQVADDKDITYGQYVFRQGYQQSRIKPGFTSLFTGGNYDSQVYGLTSPGFHSFAMDDRKENCRVRLRTTSGNQVLLDDTNERIYVSSANGNNWVEMDLNGNIDVYGKNISFHSTGDMNFTSDKTIRMDAAQGIHLHSGTEIRSHSVLDTHLRSDSSIRMHAGAVLYIQSEQDMNLRSGGNILETASQIHLNGPEAAPASEKYAFWTSRVPQHEPYARTMMSAAADGDGPGNAHIPEFSYDDPNVNRVERGDQISRGPNWKR